MKKLMVVAVLATTSTVASAFDYKFNIEGRADFVNANVKTTAQAGVTTTEKYNNFSNGLVRFNVLGAINDNLSYRFRYRFAKAAAAPTTAVGSVGTTSVTSTTLREETGTSLDYLFVDHKNSLFTTRFGKQNWNGFSYGREGIVSGTDVFLVSQAATNYKSGFGSDYRWGLTAMFKFMDTNTLDLAVSNPNSSFTDTSGAAAAPEKKNTGLALGAFYTGTFASKMLQPILAYQVAKQNGDTDSATPKTKDGNHTMWNAGLRSEVAGFVVDADYKEFKKENRNDTGTTTLPLQKTKSIYANVAYAIGDFTPMATYINDKYTTEATAVATDANFKRNSFAVGTYWKPMSDVNFRYHLMFTNAVTKYEGTVATNSKIKDSKFYFGFKADI